MLFLAYIAIPIFGIPGLSYEFTLSAIMIPVCIFTITTLGLNILLGFAGQISLGTGAFMGVGAYSCYKFMTIFPDLNILICVVLSGLVTAFVGMIFGLPSLRIKGFYLMVATLAAQFSPISNVTFANISGDILKLNALKMSFKPFSVCFNTGLPAKNNFSNSFGQSVLMVIAS